MYMDGSMAEEALACNLTLSSETLKDVSGCYVGQPSSNTRGRWVEPNTYASIYWKVLIHPEGTWWCPSLFGISFPWLFWFTQASSYWQPRSECTRRQSVNRDIRINMNLTGFRVLICASCWFILCLVCLSPLDPTLYNRTRWPLPVPKLNPLRYKWKQWSVCSRCWSFVCVALQVTINIFSSCGVWSSCCRIERSNFNFAGFCRSARWYYNIRPVIFLLDDSTLYARYTASQHAMLEIVCGCLSC